MLCPSQTEHRMSKKIRVLILLDYLNLIRKRFLVILEALGILSILAGFVVVLFHIGFLHKDDEIQAINGLYNIILWVLVIETMVELGLKKWKKHEIKNRISKIFSVVLLVFIIEARTDFMGVFPESWLLEKWLQSNVLVYIVFIAALVFKFSTNSLELSTRNVNPALLFVFSFFFIILFGSGLLMMPNATNAGIGFTDAFFTATSAVCVTGLIVVDTATHFTILGQIIIGILIQIGGLGIMTFTSFFGYFFKGGSSIGHEFLLKELLNEDKLGEIFNTLLKIMTLTFSIELLGAVLIYTSVDPSFNSSQLSLIGFSVFHSVSAFCNAGFSTLTDGLYDVGIRTNYPLQLTISGLIIIGGLGFPIVFNYYRLLRHYGRNFYNQLTGRGRYVHLPQVININTRIVMITTAILLLVGTAVFMLTEYNNTLRDLPLNGKLVGAFFGSVTTRTAGFNTIDMSALMPLTVIACLFLMWVGASPASTGGGIKTTTFALTVLNTTSIMKGKGRIEIFSREIANESVRRAYAVVFLSLVVIACSVIMIMVFEGKKFGLDKVIFEVVSAYGTVGLTLGITSSLTIASKWTLIITMFLGRVGTLTLLVGFFRKLRSFQYHYPKSNIMIN